ncbi:hypothetical protein Ahy_A09g043424 [Arachis hypogaea]|uniref:PB1-like domain-containing protein n=1 Tax=Arachis hypogaea TaxID=3818 RepID=A0A445BIA1_ARAHY|nr:hypothetical protein Ahy_A09g043424 [Arachis hypogaea]
MVVGDVGFLYARMDAGITIVYNHGDSFVTKPNDSLVYDNDHTDELTGLDQDLLDVFSLRDYYKVQGYDNMVECWWLIPVRPMKSGLRALSHDKEKRVHIYYEHGVFQPMVDEAPELIELTPNATGVDKDVKRTTPNPNNDTPTIPSEETNPEPPEFTTIHSKSPINSTTEGPSNAASNPQPQYVSNFQLKETPQPKPTPKKTLKPKLAPKETHKPIPNPAPKPKSTSKPAPKPKSTSNTTKPTLKSGSKPNPTPKSAPKTNQTPKSVPKSKATSSKSTLTTIKSSTRLKEKVETSSKTTYISLDDSNGSDSDAHDSCKSADDSLYKPGPQDSSTESDIEGGLSRARLRKFKLKHTLGAS